MNQQQYLLRYVAAWCSAYFVFYGAAQAQASDPQLDPGVDLSDAAYPVVITPTRLRQSLADVPASVTVITAEMMRRRGITRIEEALRMVPGMAVSQATGNDYRINYHGTRSVAPRRLNVLVDGVSVYMPALSQVEWSLLPVVLEDIDRIEVIRGPDSAAYGPNSMMAVINILTKHPKDVERGLVSTTVGSHGEVEGTVRLAKTLGSTSVRLTGSMQRDDGVDRTTTTGQGHDSTRLRKLSLRAQHELGDGSALDVQATYVGGTLERDYAEPFQASHPDVGVDTGLLSARWTKSLSTNHEFQVEFSRAESTARQEWVSCWPQAAFWPEVAALYKSNPDYVKQLWAGNLAPSGPATAYDNILLAQIQAHLFTQGVMSALSPTCGTTNQNGVQSRTQIELQDTFVVSPALRLVGGLGVRYQEASSYTYFSGRVHNSVEWLFGHAEYRPWEWLIANVGGYGETNSLGGSTFSPRLALNARLDENQTVRAVVSRGTRTPDLFEERADWHYRFTNLSVPVNNATSGELFASGQGVSGLSSEQILSRELGYLYISRSRGVSFDARVFDDRLSHLISEVLSAVDFAADNSGSVRLTGVELQTQWDVSANWSTWLNYSYLLNRQASHVDERAQYARHSGAAGVSVALSTDWRAALAYYGASGDGVNEVRYARTDLTLSRAFMWGGQPGSASFTLGYLDTPTVVTFQEVGRTYTSTYDRRLSVHGQLRMAF
jgi:iron complex outermembrane receptor protein